MSGIPRILFHGTNDAYLIEILVKFVFGYAVPKTCVRRVEKEGVVLSNEQSDTSRTRIKGQFSIYSKSDNGIKL